VSITDIRECLNKLEKQGGISNHSNENEISDNILVVNRQDKTIFIDIQQILRMEAAGSYTDIYLEDGTKINSTKKMNYYETILAKHPFYKLHRSHFVNLNKIREIIKNEGDGMVVMQDGSRIEISRAKKDEFLRSIIKDKKL
jgi:two-component system LytT family response regulator